MSETLMLVNPKKRRKARSAAQRAATRKMIAANRRGRRSNPAARPAKSSTRRRRRSNPIAASTVMRRRRRNPISMKSPLAMVKNAAIAGSGALAVNAAVNYLPLPDMLKTGRMVYLTKFGLALALGTFGKRILGANAERMAEGAMTVLAATAINDFAANSLGVNLSGAGYFSPGWQANPNIPRTTLPLTAQLGRRAGQYLPPMQSEMAERRSFRGVGQYVSGR